MKQNIAVIFGGVSPEHDISIITGVQVINNINTYLYNVIPLYITKTGEVITNKKFSQIETFKSDVKGSHVMFDLGNSQILVKGKFKYKKVPIHACVVCTHGRNGEDGTISGLLNLCKIPYTCGDILSSAVGCDKVIFKDILKSLNINYLPYVELNEKDYYNDVDENINTITNQLQFPLIIKPARLGSSIGIKVCEDVSKLQDCVEYSLQFDNKLILEQFEKDIKEVNISIYNNNGLIVSNIEQPLKQDEILTFENKYIGGKLKGMEGGKRITPNITKAQRKYIIDSSKKVYSHLGLKGVVRFDYIISDKVYLNEINTIPGSMANYLHEGSFANQLTEQIKQAIYEYNLQCGKVNYFNSSVLKSVNLEGIKK